MSARRQARAGGGTSALEVDGRRLTPPAELLDADHPLWADRDRYLTWMAARGWTPTPMDRAGASTHPHNRRNDASDQWAREQSGAFSSYVGDHRHIDWNKLRRAGLVT